MSEPPEPLRPSFFGGNVERLQDRQMTAPGRAVQEEPYVPPGQQEHLEPGRSHQPQNRRTQTSKNVSRLWALGILAVFNADNPAGIILGLITFFLGLKMKQKGLKIIGIIATLISAGVMIAKRS